MSIESESRIKDFTDLIAWQKAHMLVLATYKITRAFPESEKFVLSNQMTRAAISITSNIAEGFGRNTKKDKMHFYSIAKGSALELRSQLHIARDLKYIAESTFSEFENNSKEVIRLISGIIRTASDRE